MGGGRVGDRVGRGAARRSGVPARHRLRLPGGDGDLRRPAAAGAGRGCRRRCGARGSGPRPRCGGLAGRAGCPPPGGPDGALGRHGARRPERSGGRLPSGGRLDLARRSRRHGGRAAGHVDPLGRGVLGGQALLDDRCLGARDACPRRIGAGLAARGQLAGAGGVRVRTGAPGQDRARRRGDRRRGVQPLPAAPQGARARHTLVRTVSAEAVVLVAVVLVTGFLVQQNPPASVGNEAAPAPARSRARRSSATCKPP